MNLIKYKKGYKYQLVSSFFIDVSIFPEEDIISEWVSLNKKGRLIIKEGYAWDGPSGCAIDTKTFMRGALVHDALYQLMRAGKLNSVWRENADKEMKKVCLEDGMSKIRAWYVYHAVRKLAVKAAWPSSRKKIYCAP